jgi:hypothetical protein
MKSNQDDYMYSLDASRERRLLWLLALTQFTIEIFSWSEGVNLGRESPVAKVPPRIR